MAHHRLLDAVELLAEFGYRGVAVTIDHHALPPDEPGTPDQLDRLRTQLQRHRMRTVIETGVRFLLDPNVKHEPTLVSPSGDARRRRVDFYRHTIDCAARLGADCVSIWSGVLRDGATRDEAVERLRHGLADVLGYADQQDVTLGFEPEPGMFIDTLARFEELLGAIDHPRLGLTLDVGHVHCQCEGSLGGQIRRWADRLVNVHLDDARRGRHEHLMLGEGEIDFTEVFAALTDARYAGGVYVELSRHSHIAPEAARRAMEYCRPWIEP